MAGFFVGALAVRAFIEIRIMCSIEFSQLIELNVCGQHTSLKKKIGNFSRGVSSLEWFLDESALFVVLGSHIVTIFCRWLLLFGSLLCGHDHCHRRQFMIAN